MERAQLTPELQNAASSLAGSAYQPINPVNPAENAMAQPNALLIGVPGPIGTLPAAQAPPLMPTPEIPKTPLAGLVPGSFASKMAIAADKLGIPKGPGGWARSLVGAAQHALSGATEALADAAAAKPLEPGEGGLAAIGNIRNAQVARQQAQQKFQTEQDKDRALIAKTNADTIMQETILHNLKGKMADKANDEAISNGLLVFNAAVQGDPDHGVPGAPIIAKDISEAQLNRALQDQSWNPTKESWQATGKVPSYENGKQRLDKDGNPMWDKTYSIVGIPPEIILNKERVKFLSDNGVLKSDGSKWDVGQVMPGALGMSQFQQAHNTHALQQKQKEERETAELGEASTEQKLSAFQAEKNLGPEFFTIAGQADLNVNRTMNFITGQHMIPDPTGKNPSGIVDPRSSDYAAKHPNAGNDFINYMGGLKDFTIQRNKQMEDAETMRHNYAMELEKVTKDKNDAVTNIGGILTDDMKAQIAALPEDRQAVLEQYPNQMGSLLSVALGPGDVDFRSVFSPRPTKGSHDLSAQNALPVLKAINPNWSEQQYNAMHNAYKEITQGKEGIQVAQYNNVLNHAAGLQDIMESSARGKTPAFLNTAINAMERAGWGAEATKITTEIEAVKGEYELLMNAGYKPSEPEQAIYNKIISGSATPGQIGAFLKAVGAVGAVRLEQINEQYKRIAGKNLPGILTEETIDAAKHLNLDAQAMQRLARLDVGGTIFHSQNWKSATPTEVQQQDATKQGQQLAGQAANSVQYKAYAQGPNGHTLGYNGTAWVDIKTGQPIAATSQGVK